MYRLIIKTLICLIPLLWTTIRAETNWYQVEVIVFDYLNPDLDRELWYQNPGLPQSDMSIELITDVPDEIDVADINTLLDMESEEEQDQEEITDEALKPDLVPYLALPEDKFRLKNDYRILKLSSGYRPLLHVAWQQPGLQTEEVRFVHLEGIVEEKPSQQPLIQEPGNIIDVGSQVLIEQIYKPPEMIFAGNIRLRSTKFLHIDVDIAYFPKDFTGILNRQVQKDTRKDSSLANYEADYVRLTESRRIRLNELHYFDHPLFGVILQVSRIETEE